MSESTTVEAPPAAAGAAPSPQLEETEAEVEVEVEVVEVAEVAEAVVSPVVATPPLSVLAAPEESEPNSGGTGVATFNAPVIQDNPFGWGPCEVLARFRDMPYQPFSKGDRLGKISDWTCMQDKRYASQYHNLHTSTLPKRNVKCLTG